MTVDLTRLHAHEMGALLRTGDVSAVELLEAHQALIERQGRALNAWRSLDPEGARAAAEAADRRLAEARAAGDEALAALPALLGVPVALKDLVVTRGRPSTAGSRILEGYVGAYDAHIAERLEAAGAVVVGKTNMDEFAMGSSNETSYFGAVKNPWDTARVPGGSSGGAAACVAARMAPAATGTDTGGSIRQPAALCGITGLKPTYGLVSRYGMIAFASSLDQAGPMARSAEDCALLLNAMTGFDPNDSTSLDREKEDYTRDLEQPLTGLRVGLPREFFAEGLNNDVAAAVDAAVTELKKLGATTVEISLANSKLAIPVYYVLAPAEASSNLSRFDGVRYGYRAPEYANLDDMYCKTRAQGFGAEVKRRILIGAYVLSHGYYDAYYLQAQKIRRLIADDFTEAFKTCDMILGPTVPGTAFRLGEKSGDPIEMYLNDLYTIPANLAGLPGMSLPCGFDSQGLPIGLQLVGNYFSEAKMLNVAHLYQRVTDWHARAPEGLK